MITITLFVFVVFLFSYLFNVPVHHPDTLFFLLAFFAIGIRFLIIKKGRQRGEIFSWLISIILFTWVAVVALNHLYSYISGPLNEFGFHFITDYFSKELNLRDAMSKSLPGNPYVLSLSFLIFMITECLWIPKVEPSICGPWSLCYEIDSEISRVIGESKILNKAKNMIQKASKYNCKIIWVTTTLRAKIYDELSKAQSLPKIEIIIMKKHINSMDLKRYDKICENNIPNNISIKLSSAQFPRGFLLIPDKEVLLTSFPIRDMPFIRPSIGFYSKDIAVISKLYSIYKGL